MAGIGKGPRPNPTPRPFGAGPGRRTWPMSSKIMESARRGFLPHAPSTRICIDGIMPLSIMPTKKHAINVSRRTTDQRPAAGWVMSVPVEDPDPAIKAKDIRPCGLPP
jgi:hypothetical protein